MTKSQILKIAHEEARKIVKRFGGTYREAIADAIRAVHATIRYEADCDRKYGAGMRPGFQIVEPERLWA
jgi:hypothetical protein